MWPHFWGEAAEEGAWEERECFEDYSTLLFHSQHYIGLFKMFSQWILHIFTAQIQSE